MLPPTEDKFTGVIWNGAKNLKFCCVQWKNAFATIVHREYLELYPDLTEQL